MSCCIRIERMANAYRVCVTDPDIAAKNKKAGSWKDPAREYSFVTKEEVLAFLKKNIDRALPEEDYDSAFEVASSVSDSKDK